ncbi:MAG TPA: ArsA family ATPase [Syntrophales bacterium]|nr:ArsA family ATPase [Syntrophales bacterium]
MRIVFYTGKGGVGKSTIAAASAWQLSRTRRVLIVSLDPAHNLGDIFRVTLGKGDKRFNENLVLREIDLKKLSRNYLEREISVLSGTYKYLQAFNLDRYFSVLKYSPGIEEYALLTSIDETIRGGKDFDYIVFDTPPTGLTLRFLALPQVTMAWIDRLIQIRKQILEKRYTIQKIMRPLKEGENNPEVRLDYTEEGDEVLQRLRFLNENYQGLSRILRSEQCGFVLVFNPDLLSLRESERIVEGLRDLKLPLRLLIDNKVTEENRETAAKAEEELRTATGGVPVERVLLSGMLGGEKGLYEIPEDLVSILH